MFLGSVINIPCISTEACRGGKPESIAGNFSCFIIEEAATDSHPCPIEGDFQPTLSLICPSHQTEGTIRTLKVSTYI